MAGRCRERRYADHIFIQIILQNAPFRSENFQNFLGFMRQGGIDPPNQNPVDVPGLDGSLNGLEPSRDRLKQSRPKQDVSTKVLCVAHVNGIRHSCTHHHSCTHVRTCSLGPRNNTIDRHLDFQREGVLLSGYLGH